MYVYIKKRSNIKKNSEIRQFVFYTHLLKAFDSMTTVKTWNKRQAGGWQNIWNNLEHRKTYKKHTHAQAYICESMCIHTRARARARVVRGLNEKSRYVK